MKPRSGLLRASRRRSGGFTLLEVLVVLVITGMAVTLLWNGLADAQQWDRSLARQVVASQGEAMQWDWYRQVIQGLQPDYPDGDHKFAGSRLEVAGLTTNPLSGDYGATTSFKLRLQTQGRRSLLKYESNNASTVIAEWEGDGAFVFINTKGESSDVWPPPFGSWPQLPAMVAIKRGGPEPLMIYAAHRGPDRQLQRTRDLLGITG